jgi:ADP-heptose:LPS heptosyltransferase
MGDVVHCLPLAARIKERLPNVELTWLVEPAAQDLLHGNPAVDRVLLFPRKTWLKEMRKVGPLISTFGAAKKYFQELKDYKFDLAIDAQGLLKSAIPAYLSGAPLRVGFAGTREGAAKLLTHALEVGDYFGPDRHVVELNMALADFALETLARERSTCIRLAGRDRVVHVPLPDPGKDCLAFVSSKLDNLGRAPEAGQSLVQAEAPEAEPNGTVPLTKSGAPKAGQSEVIGSKSPIVGPLIALIPGTTWPTKIWPEDQWIALGRLLCERLQARLVICGGPAERGTNQYIYKGIESGSSNSVIDLTGETSLMQLVALFKRCDLVLGADTGPLHLAAGVAHEAFNSELAATEPKSLKDTANQKSLEFEVRSVAVAKPKVVAIHGATPWLRNGPYGSMGSAVHLNLECQPCFEKTCQLKLKTIACLKDLPVEEVFKAVDKALAKRN